MSKVTVVPKSWGEERIWADAPGHYLGKYLHVNAGHRLSLQYHDRKDETMMLVSGEAQLLIGDSYASLTRVDLSPHDPVRIKPGVLHRLCATTDTVVLEVSTGDPDDVVRLEDDYGRAAPPCPRCATPVIGEFIWLHDGQYYCSEDCAKAAVKNGCTAN